MKIRTRIFGSAALAIAATAFATLLLWIGATRSIAADAEQEMTQATMRSIAGLLTLSQEYALRSEPRAAEQWRAQHTSLMLRLTDPAQSGETRPARQGLRVAAAELPQLFERLAELKAQPASPFAERRRDLLIDQLLAGTQGLTDSAYRWSREAAASEQVTRQRLRLGGMLALLMLLVTTLAQPIVVWRRALRPLAALERAAAAVERGDLSARCASTARDELGDVSRRFDAMTVALGERTHELERTNASLDLEVGARRLSEQHLRAITDNLPALITHIDADRRYTFVNAYLERSVGAGSPNLLGRTMREACGAKLYARLESQVDSVLAGATVDFETVVSIDGRDRHFQTHYIPEETPQGTPRGFYAVSFDITQTKKVEGQLQRSKQRLRTITDNLPVLIAYIDRGHTYRFANATFTDWFGTPVAQVEGHHLAEVLGARVYALRRPWLERALAGERVEFEQVSELPNGPRHLRCTYVPHREGDTVVGVYAMVNDVSAIKATEAKLELLASADALTGLPNRLHFEDRLGAAMEHARLGPSTMGLMFIDIDHFKSINDSLGHAAGDAVLRDFATRLRDAVRTTDTVARLRGDEFVIVLAELHAKAEAEAIAAKIVAAVGHDFVVEGRSLRVTTSIGVALFEGGRRSPSELMKQADDALYQAKSAGRDGYRMHSDRLAA